MKRKRMFASLAAILITVSSIVAMSFSAYAEETTESSIETTAKTTFEETTTAATTTTPHMLIVIDGLRDFNTWSGDGDLTVSVNLVNFEKDLGSFESLSYLGKSVNESFYSVTQNGNESFTVTLKEDYLH